MGKSSTAPAASFQWKAPGSPDIVLSEAAMEGLARDVSDVFIRVPGRGAETGGILLGRRNSETIVIEDFVAVPSEHRYGRLYKLSAADRQRLREVLDEKRDPRNSIVPVGFYRSNTRDDLAVTVEDQEIQIAHLPDAERLLLLIQPSPAQPLIASLFLWREGRMQEAVPTSEFSPRADDGFLPPAAAVPVKPRHQRRWSAAVVSTVAAIVLCGAGLSGYFGYLMGRRLNSSPLPPPPVPAAIVKRVEPPPAPPPVKTTEPLPAPSAPHAKAEVIILLDRWAAAVRRGAVEETALLYLPGEARENARDTIAGLLGNADRLDVFRIDRLEVTEPAPGQAVATFRKYWQTGGYPKSVGEQQVRMTLRKTGEQWRIASERQ